MKLEIPPRRIMYSFPRSRRTAGAWRNWGALARDASVPPSPPDSPANKHASPANMAITTTSSPLRQGLANAIYGRFSVLQRRLVSNSVRPSKSRTVSPPSFSTSTVLLCSLASAAASLGLGYSYISYHSKVDYNVFGSSIKYAEPATMFQVSFRQKRLSRD